MQQVPMNPKAIARTARKAASRSAAACVQRRGRAVPAHVVTHIYAAAHARATRILMERAA